MSIQELLDFIKKSKEAGQGDEEIKSALKSAGWQEGDIEEGFKSAGSSGLLGQSASSGQATQTMPQSEPAKPAQNYSDILYGNKQESAVVTPGAKSSKKLVIAIVILFILLAGAASAYYFKDDLAGLPVIKDWVKKGEPVAVVDNGQQQEQQETAELPKTDENKKVVTPTPQQPQKQDCGSVINTHLFVSPQDITVQEKNSMSCINQALEKCSPATFELLGAKGGGMEEGSMFEIKIKDSSTCSITQKMENSSAIKTCKYPLSLISSSVQEAEKQGKSDYLFVMVTLMSVAPGGKVTDTKTGEVTIIQCQ